MRDPDLDYREPIVLHDGRQALIRVVRPDDRARLQAAFAKLTPGTIYSRFFTYRKEIPPAALERIAQVDFGDFGALVVTVGAGSAEEVIAGASWAARTAEDAARVAEVAFTVEEDFQGQRLASRLLAALAALARRHGIARFEADVLVGNTSMLGVFECCGLPLRHRSEDGVVHLEIDLSPPPS